MCWPLESVDRIDRVQECEILRLFLPSPKGNIIKIFRFFTNEECKTWYEQMLDLLNKRQPTHPVSISHLEIEPVLLLQTRPYERYQLLGQLEAKSTKWSQARVEIQLSAAVLGADAVVDVREERLPDFFRSIRRISGTAIRAVDQAGRLGLKSRWYADQISRLTRLMFIMLIISSLVMFTVFAIAVFVGALPQGSQTDGRAPVYLGVLFLIALVHSGPFVMIVLLRGSSGRSW